MPLDSDSKIDLKPRFNRGRAFAIILLYALFAAMWILLSDKLVQFIFTNPNQIILASMLKGWFYVAVTTALLYWLIHNWLADSDKTEELRLLPARMSIPLIVLIIVITAFTAVGIIQTFIHKKKMAVDELHTVAAVKTHQIADWLKERQADVGFIQDNPVFIEHFHRWLKENNRNSADLMQKSLEQFRQTHGYSNVILLNSKGEIIWSSSKRDLQTNLQTFSYFQHQLPKLNNTVEAPYRDADGNIYQDVVVTLAQISDQGHWLVLQVDLKKWLIPNLDVWPGPNEGRESDLLWQAGDQFHSLKSLKYQKNDLVHQRDPALTIQQTPVSSMAPKGTANNALEIADYRNVPVIAVTNRIADNNWLLIAKMDQSILLSEAIQASVWPGLVGLLAIFVTSVGFYLLCQQQQLENAKAERDFQVQRLKALNLLAIIADSSDDAIFAKDSEGRYILFNRAASQIVGKSVEEVLGHDDKALFPIEQAENLIAVGQKIMLEKCCQSAEEILTTAQGERIFLATKGPLQDEQGKVVGHFGIARDITEQKLAESALRESESRYRALVEQSLAGIYIIQDGYFRYLNPGFAAIFGYDSPDELIDQFPVADLISPEDRQFVAENIRQRIEDKTDIFRYQVTCLHRLGHRLVTEAHCRRFEYKGGPAIIGLILDITARKEAELAVRAERDHNQRYLDAMQTIMVALDIEGKITMLNRAGYALLGHKHDELVGKNWFDTCLPQPDGRDKIYPIFQQLVNGNLKAFENYENPILCADGRQLTITWRNAYLTGPTGEVTGVLSSGLDITELKAVETNLHVQQHELIQQNTELERFNRAMIGRELDMINLKGQINELSQLLGLKPPYRLDLLSLHESGLSESGEAK